MKYPLSRTRGTYGTSAPQRLGTYVGVALVRGAGLCTTPHAARDRMIEHAVAYARLGLRVLPIWSTFGITCACGRSTCPSPGKHPHGILGDKGGLNLASCDESVVRSWWERAPDASIGIALRASGLVAFDVDKPDNYEQLRAAIIELGPLPRSPEQRSGSGNYHLIYKAPAFDVVGLFRGITMRAKNYIVVSPSLHASGNRYAWEPGLEPWAVPPAELPLTWQEALRRPVSVGEVGVPAEDLEPAWLRSVLHTERVARMREHLAAQEGEVKGTSRQRLAWDVARTCARGFAIRDPDALLQILATEYDTRCIPPYGVERVAQRVQKVYDSASEPEWGSSLKPHDETLRGIGLDPTVVAAGHEPEDSEQKFLSQLASEVAAKEPPPMRFYATGFPALDELLGGGVPSRQQVGIVAPPSCGKSGLVGKIAQNLESIIPVLHVSTELPCDELMVRHAAVQMGFAWREGMKGKISRAEMRASLDGKRIRLVGQEDLPRGAELRAIYTEAVRLAEQYNMAPAVIVDYVQLLARGKEDGLRARVGELSRELRVISQALDSPVLSVYSTGRGFYGQSVAKIRALNDPLAYLPAAKESGDIEFDCATILFLDVDQMFSAPEKPSRIAVARCRVGDIGFVGARFNGPTGNWSEDESALDHMRSLGAVGRSGKEIANDAADDKHMLELLPTCSHMFWRDVREVFSRRFSRRKEFADSAKTRLLDGKKIESWWPLDEHGRTKKGSYYRVVRDIIAPSGPAVDLTRYERKP